MDKTTLAFDKGNFVALACGVAVILVGLVLMSGGESTTDHYDPTIFNAMHTSVAPIVTFVGFVSIIYAIVRKPKEA